MNSKQIIAVFFTALMIFSGLVILENNNIHDNMKQVQYVKHISPELSNFTFNYTPKAGQYWDVDFNGQVKVSSGDQISFTAPAGNYTFDVLTPQGQYSGNAIIRLSGVPWWYTVGSSALAGASVGFIAGGPLGALVGGIAGGIIGGIFAYFFGNSPNSDLTATQEAELMAVESETNNTMTSIYNMINEAESMLSVITSLTNSSFYYFAQEMEAVGQRYINSSFNESQLELSSGVLLQMAKIMQPLFDAISYAYVELSNWGLESMSGASNVDEYVFGTQAPTISGEELKGGYYMLDGNNTFFYIQNLSMNLKNAFTGQEYNITTPTKSSITTYYYGSNTAGAGIEASQTSPLAGFTKTNLTGLYYITATGGDSQDMFTDALYLGSTWWGNELPNDMVYKSFFLKLGDSYSSIDSMAVPEYTLCLNPSTQPGIEKTITSNNGGSGSSLVDNYLIDYNYTEGPISNMFSAANNAFNNAYSAYEVMIGEYEALGIYNFSQIPANETIPFPSWFVPASLLNGSFNETELYALYVAYLQSLNNTFHNEKHLTGNDSINQTIFSGFAQETGILNLSNNYSGHKEINGTFLIEINQGKLHFQVGQRTIFTAQTPVIVVSGYYGDPTYINGSLIQASANSSFYTEAIIVNGTSQQSYTLSGQLIKVYLYSPGNLTSFPTGAFFLNNKVLEYLIIAALIIVVLAAVIVGIERKDHKKGKKRTN